MPQARKAKQPTTKQEKETSQSTLIAIYNSIDLIATCFPEASYRLYQEKLITKHQFIDEVINRLSTIIEVYPDYEPLHSVNESLQLTSEEYDQVYSWISRTTIFKKNETWYKCGVRSEADVIAIIEDVRVKSLEVYKDLLEDGDKATAQVVAISIRSIVDLAGIRARTEANYVYQNECNRIESEGYLEKAQ